MGNRRNWWRWHSRVGPDAPAVLRLRVRPPGTARRRVRASGTVARIRGWAWTALAPVVLALPLGGQEPEGPPVPQELLVRYEYQGRRAYGRVDGGLVRELPGTDIFTAAVSAPTGRSYALASVRTVQPVEPELVEKVLGVAQGAPATEGGSVRHPRWYAMFPIVAKP